MKNLFTALAYVLTFFGSIAGAFFFTWLLVEFQYGMAEINDFPVAFISARTFTLALCFTMVIACMFQAFMILRMLDKRSA